MGRTKMTDAQDWRRVSGARRRVAVATLAVAGLFFVAAPARAAILGSLTPSSAHPGDWVELTTDPGDSSLDVYSNIAAAGPAPLWLQRVDASALGNQCVLRVGNLTWNGGVGHARFQLPALEPGRYWLLTTVQGACWRFGHGSGLLTLTVLPTDQGPMPGLLVWMIVALAGLAAFSVGLLVRLHSRRSSEAPAAK
jgi:hypothetical protein